MRMGVNTILREDISVILASGWGYHHIPISPRASGFGWAITIFSMEWFATLSPELADLDELAVE